MDPFQINKNKITLKNLNNITQDFGKLLKIRDSITYINCNNISIVINSPINKIIIKNCCNLQININKIICGIEIVKSNNIKITTTKNKPIYYVYIDASEKINVELNKKIFRITKIDILDSFDIIFTDFKNNKLINL